jgi:hypothetical protein
MSEVFEPQAASERALRAMKDGGPLVVAVRDHQGKSRGFRDALREQGWWVAPPGMPADVLLLDHDIDRQSYRDMIENYRHAGAKVVLYPHGAAPIWDWDGWLEPYPVDACLVIGSGYRDAMDSYGYPCPIHVVGWSYCRQRPFHGRPPQRVLFAPIHPLGTGYMDPRFRAANARAYRTLLEWDVELTVRHIGPLELNGLWPESDVMFEVGEPDGSVRSIDAHDLVVATDTFLSLAVARGIPAVAFHQVQPVGTRERDEDPVVTFPHWDPDLCRYPYDLEDPASCVEASRVEATEWRARFIGGQLDPAVLSGVLEAVCSTTVSVTATPV